MRYENQSSIYRKDASMKIKAIYRKNSMFALAFALLLINVKAIAQDVEASGGVSTNPQTGNIYTGGTIVRPDGSHGQYVTPQGGGRIEVSPGGGHQVVPRGDSAPRSNVPKKFVESAANLDYDLNSIDD